VGSPLFYIAAFDKDFTDALHCASFWFIGERVPYTLTFYFATQTNPVFSIAWISE